MSASVQTPLVNARSLIVNGGAVLTDGGALRTLGGAAIGGVIGNQVGR